MLLQLYRLIWQKVAKSISNQPIKEIKKYTYFAWPAPRFKFEVKLARLASRSPETNLPPGPVPFPVPPLAPGTAPTPPTPPCGCKISPKKLAPTPIFNRKKWVSFWESYALSFYRSKMILNCPNHFGHTVQNDYRSMYVQDKLYIPSTINN